MYSVSLQTPADFDGWRAAARRLRGAGVSPREVGWRVRGDAARLFDGARIPNDRDGNNFPVSRAFIDLARDMVCHRNEDRFDLAYRLLCRLDGEPRLLSMLTDPQVGAALSMQNQVRKAIHKMHAFVRFRRLEGVEPETLAAWFEPPHYVIERGVDYFVRRLANLRFSIISPYVSALWDGATMQFGPGGAAGDVPAGDAREADWQTYFASIFNPARLNPRLMAQHMAKSYWGNLPEAALIPELVSTARERATTMVQTEPTLPSPRIRRVIEARQPSTETGDAEPQSLDEISQAIQICKRCDLWRMATQGVPGDGPSQARLMIVGEQPGDQEDLAGHPFVGPAGALLDRALAEAGIDRREVYVTNAVKHFKYEPRGKRRIHSKPNAGEVQACKWWLDHELQLVRPKLVVALGATAAGSLLGRPVSPIKERGRAGEIEGGAQVIVTVHPSYLLRIPDEAGKAAAYAAFVEDLRLVG
ncbi:MAG: phage polymerase-related protein [Caulobacteraceae bacterium]|nr:phage polymerase-related protein [Caulobacteraceae bacterium]